MKISDYCYKGSFVVKLI